MKMLHDPIQAFFDGITSTFARVLVAVSALFLAFGTYAISQPGFDLKYLLMLPLMAFGVIFAWGTKGLLFFVGLSAIIAFFCMAWRFLTTSHPKELFIGLYLVAFIYFIPFMWDADFVIWKTLAATFLFLTAYAVVAYVIPGVMACWESRRAS